MPAFIIADNDSIASRVRQALIFCGQECPASHILGIDQATSKLAREPKVDLIVVVLPPDLDHAVGILPSLSRIAPGKILATGPASDSKLVLRALRSGADDYVDASDLEAELETAIARMAAAAAGPAEPGRLIVVLAPNGGSGASTFAANIATALAQEHKAVGLFDMKLKSGDLAALLDLRPAYTLADLCQNSSRLDKVMFERSLVKHDSGVQLLAPPLHLADVSHVRSEGVDQAIALARATFPYVVVDLDHTFREEQLVILRQADIVLIVFRLDFTSLKNVHRTLQHLETLGIAGDKIHLAVNRRGQSQEVAVGKAEEALGRKINSFVPEDAKTINRANNHGVPVVIEAPSSKVAKSLIELAKSVNGRPPGK